MRFLRNKFFIGVLCIILGLVIGFVAIPQVQNKGTTDLVQAVRLKQDVSQGEEITEDMVETVTISQKLIPSGTVDSVTSFASRFAVTQLFAGDYLTSGKLADAQSTQDSLALATAKGMKVISITLPSLASSVSGQLQPGDVVTVLSLLKNNTVDQSQTLNPQVQTAEDTTADTSSTDATPAASETALKPETLLYPELQYIEVCSISASDGSDAIVSKTPSEDSKNNLPVTISLYVTESQALRLAELEQSGVMHLVFVARGADAAPFITDDIRVLNLEVE